MPITRLQMLHTAVTKGTIPPRYTRAASRQFIAHVIASLTACLGAVLTVRSVRTLCNVQKRVYEIRKMYLRLAKYVLVLC